MDDLSARMRSSFRMIIIILAIFLLAWAFLADYRYYLTGLILGTIAGAFNARHLAWRVRQFADAAAEGRGRKSLGFATRASLALLVVFGAMKLDYSIVATIIGLFFIQLAILVMGIFTLPGKK
jgi:ATP synthase protein I